MAVVNAASAADFERLTAGLVRLGPAFVSSGLSRKAPQAVAHFWASWCEPCAQMDAVFAQLALSQPHVSFVRVRALLQAAAGAHASDWCSLCASPG